MPPAVHVKRWFLVVIMGCLLASSSTRAETPEELVPEPLRPWTAWALKGAEDQRCVEIEGVHTCVFPTALTLSVRAHDASFELRVSLDRAGEVVLPGSRELFPLDVREGKQALPVIDTDGHPQVALEVGTHVLTGRFEFAQLPDALQVPVALGSLKLDVSGVRVAFPKRDASGLVWLKQGAGGTEQERLNLSVHRRIDDGIPLRLTTRIHLSAGGKAREALLSDVLVSGTRPIALKADLPSELTPEGALRVQIQAGEHDVEILSIAEGETPALTAPKAGEPWPENEIWVFKSDERLRHVELSGPSQIDPARTDLPPDFRGLPAYVMPGGQTLHFETRRRGEPAPPPNQLSIDRSLWLDLDGDGYTVRDEIRGTMQRDFRLDLASASLGHVVDHGEDQVITTYGTKNGVELRSQGVQLDTEWRLAHGRALPAVGYSEDAHSLSATLHLPPGFLLLGAEGVDELSGAWLDTWDLFDFFFVLLVSLAVAKVSGTLWGVCALVALTLTHHQPDAPTGAWVFLLAMTALHVALKRERLAPFIRAGWYFAAGCVVLVLLPFSVMQVRKALYPHLAPDGSGMWELALGTAREPLSMSAPPNAGRSPGRGGRRSAPGRRSRKRLRRSSGRQSRCARRWRTTRRVCEPGTGQSRAPRSSSSTPTLSYRRARVCRAGAFARTACSGPDRSKRTSRSSCGSPLLLPRAAGTSPRCSSPAYCCSPCCACFGAIRSSRPRLRRPASPNQPTRSPPSPSC